MQLQFPQRFWNQRYRFTLQEILHMEEISSSIKFNKEKWKRNSYKYMGQKIYYAEGPLKKEHGKRDGIQEVYYSTGLKIYDDYHLWDIVDQYGSENGASAINEGCDIHCVSCNYKFNEEVYSPDLPILMIFNENIERAEILCEKCYEEIYPRKYIKDNVHKEEHLIALIQHLNTIKG